MHSVPPVWCNPPPKKTPKNTQTNRQITNWEYFHRWPHQLHRRTFSDGNGVTFLTKTVWRLVDILTHIQTRFSVNRNRSGKSEMILKNEILNKKKLTKLYLIYIYIQYINLDFNCQPKYHRYTPVTKFTT